jgi:hypothetical protein
MEPTDALDPLRKRRTLLLHFRWLLFLWLGATLALQNDLSAGQNLPPTTALLGLMLLSQATLWLLPLRHMEGLRVYYAVFVLDLALILMNLGAAGHMRQDLVIAFFAGIFVAALSKRVGMSFLTALALTGAYVGVRARAGGPLPWQSEQLLDLPFLFIASIHSGLVAQAAESESESKRRLLSDHSALARLFKNTVFDANRFNHDIKALLDTLPFAVVMLDGSNGIRFFNSTAELVFGVIRNHVAGSLIDKIPELAGLRDALERQDQSLDGGFQRVDIDSVEGHPLQLILSTYRVDPGEGGAVGTLMILMPIPFHQGVAEYIASAPLDERPSPQRHEAVRTVPLEIYMGC